MPSIPGPYCSPEQTESFPLKPGAAGNRGNGLRSVVRCFGGSADKSGSGSGLRIIVLCFVVITLAVAIALAVQIYYGDYQVSKLVLFVGWSAAGN